MPFVYPCSIMLHTIVYLHKNIKIAMLPEFRLQPSPRYAKYIKVYMYIAANKFEVWGLCIRVVLVCMNSVFHIHVQAGCAATNISLL